MTQIYTMIAGVTINDMQLKKIEETKNDGGESINDSSNKILVSNPLVGLSEFNFSETREI